jgi:hypothetical protein
LLLLGPPIKAWPIIQAVEWKYHTVFCQFYLGDCWIP